MNILDDLTTILIKEIKRQFEIDSEILKPIEIIIPKITVYGDLSTNIAIILGQYLSLDPIMIADNLKNSLYNLKYIKLIKIVKPGFINFFVENAFWHNILKNFLNPITCYYANPIIKSQNVQLIYISPNNLKSQELNHLRGLAYKNSLNFLLKKTYPNVISKNIVNDLIDIKTFLKLYENIPKNDKYIFILNILPTKLKELHTTFNGSIIKSCHPISSKHDMLRLVNIQQNIDYSYSNPTFSVHYVQTRINSLFDLAQEICPIGWEAFKKNNYDLSLLNHSNDLDLMKILTAWPLVLQKVIITYEPHQINLYMEKLAAKFHYIWQKARESRDYYFVERENPELTAARLALIKSLQNILLNGLNILGINIS